jgi:hypothetical protein
MTKQFKLLLKVLPFLLLFPACANTTPTSAPPPATASPTPPSSKVWRIAVVSDMNQGYGDKTYTPALKAAIAHIRQNGTSLVISTGDMASGEKHGLDFPGMWRAFHGVTTQPLAESHIPFLPSPGNHDASAEPSYQNERDFYRASWNTYPVERFNSAKPPEDQVQFLPGVAQNFPFNYAVTMGPALFIALDATVAGRLINGQLDWLESVLQKSAPYTVKMVFGHMPLFPFTFDRAADYLGLGNSTLATRMENMLEQYRVNYFLSGHHHAYFPGRRAGSVRYVSVPLLGTGARYLMTKDRTERSRSPQAFLYFDFDAAGTIVMHALKSPSMTEITAAMIPPAISIPTKDASDCKRCASFPAAYFLDPARRIVFQSF